MTAPLRVLIGCETSGVVRRAFAARRHDAWSCDLLPSEDRSNRHIVGDVRQGYTPDNVRVVVFALNMMLSDWGQEVFDQIINAYKHHKRRKSIPGPEGHEPAPETIFNENNGIAP